MKRFLIILTLMVLTGCAPTATPLPTQTSEISETSEVSPSLTPVAPTDTPPPTSTEAVLPPTASATLAPDAWMQIPVVPTAVSDRARFIYQRGLEMGRDPHKFSKVGDCQNVESYFLAVFETPEEYSLGEANAYLSETIEYYQGSFSRDSLAVKGGFNVAAILSPLRADPEKCQKNESPLDCELNAWNPSIALVSLEEWWEDRPAEDYANYMRLAVDDAISKGVLPILATRAGNTPKVLALNAAIAQVAYENDIPLWNFWLAIQPLPSHGLSPDGFHLTFARNFFDDPLRMQSAWPWRNLTALQTLHAVRVGIESTTP
ncbi:MAG: hypothetical protein C4583_12725 [Anaerolineaceae bacterium]|nr:MAG: hypothetical protein C4583_12725 [Anaerolineaceae bacterium]